jgi:hypothetical protein
MSNKRMETRMDRNAGTSKPDGKALGAPRTFPRTSLAARGILGRGLFVTSRHGLGIGIIPSDRISHSDRALYERCDRQSGAADQQT